MVIGESQNRNRMSVYGYKDYDTTPFLSQKTKNKNWFFLDNAYSCHTHTVPVLTYALTQKNNYTKLKLKDAYAIVDMLGAFNTYWISNQKAIGAFETPITKIAMGTKNQIFTNKSFLKRSPHDEVLLKVLPSEEKLKDTSVVFIHLMGNHGKYIERYPQNFDKFPNAYDNSILYNDYIIEKIYEHFSNMKNFMALAYFSDHADDVSCKCHDASRFTWEMTKIPFYFYFSDKYIKANSEKISALKKHLHTPFTNDLMFDVLLGFLGINDARFYIPRNDLLNISYNHSEKDLTTLHGAKSLQEENTASKKREKREKTKEKIREKFRGR